MNKEISRASDSLSLTWYVSPCQLHLLYPLVTTAQVVLFVQHQTCSQEVIGLSPALCSQFFLNTATLMPVFVNMV